MVTVAIDEGPLHGPRTGVGNAVGWLFDALEARHSNDDGLVVTPYVTSMRARPKPPTRRLPLPALVAHRLWARTSRPHMDRWLGRPDVVHGTNYVVPPTSCPRLVSVYDTWFLDHPDDAEPSVARAGDVLRRAVADGAHVVTSSHATTARVRELLRTERVNTVHLGPPPAADHDRPAQRPDRLLAIGDDPFVLALGTVERRKNLPMLVRAFHRLAAEDETVWLVIAGGAGDDNAAVAAAVGALDERIARRIYLLGRVDDETKRWLLGHASALAYPSLEEGFGFPILEAQQAGLAVVASSAGSIPEIAGTGALLSRTTDVDAFAANLHWVITNPTRHDELVTRGRTNVARFSWEATVDALTDLYQEVANAT